MDTIRFDFNTHFEHYNAMRVKHNMVPASVSSIPALGFVVECNFVPVAYAFVRLVEGGYGQLDGFIVNPDFHGEQRDKALNMVTDACESKAKAIGITHLYAFCETKPPIERALRHGYAKLSHTIMVLDLTKGI
jgi:hypothetical protein